MDIELRQELNAVEKATRHDRMTRIGPRCAARPQSARRGNLRTAGQDSVARQRGTASECWRCRSWRRLHASRHDPNFHWSQGDRGGAPSLRDTGEERPGNDAVEWARWRSALGGHSTAETPAGGLGRRSLAIRRVPSLVIARGLSGLAGPGGSRRFRRVTHADHAGWLAERNAQGCGQANLSGTWSGGENKGRSPRSEAPRGLGDPYASLTKP